MALLSYNNIVQQFCFKTFVLERHIFMLVFFAFNGALREVCFFMSMGPM